MTGDFEWLFHNGRTANDEADGYAPTKWDKKLKIMKIFEYLLQVGGISGIINGK